MSSKRDTKIIGGKDSKRVNQSKPDWASGLQRLYDSVVDEPLPDSFAKLLDDLDKSDV